MPQTPINTISNKTLNPGVVSTGNVIWVAGLNGGKNWKMYPNTTDILMDNVNKDVFYIKSCDETGAIKTFKAFNYNEIPIDQVPLQDTDMPSMANFITKDEFKSEMNDFKSEILAAIKGSNNSNGYHKNNRKQNYNGGSQNDNMGRGGENTNEY